MFLTKNERKIGYEIQWLDRNTKTLTKNGIIIGSVCCRQEIESEIDKHERFLQLMDRNKIESEEHKPFTPIQITLFFAIVIALAFLADAYKG